MEENIPSNVIGAIIGGAISGGVGIAISWYTLHKRNKDEVKETVYAPLYDSIMKLPIEPIFDSYVDGEWKSLESHKKLRMDKKIKELYHKYEKLGNEHQTLLVDWGNEFDRKKEDFFSLIYVVFESREILKDKKIPLKSSYNVEVASFVMWFMHILFDNTITTSTELYEKLLSFSDNRNPIFKPWLENIHNEKPEFFEQLFCTLKEINKTFPESIDYRKLVEKRNMLKEIIIEIRDELKKRL